MSYEYADRDVCALDKAGGHYSRHVQAMTEEELRDKSDIAAELAFRDAEIERLRAEVVHWREARRASQEGGDFLKQQLDTMRAERDELRAAIDEAALLTEAVSPTSEVRDSRAVIREVISYHQRTAIAKLDELLASQKQMLAFQAGQAAALRKLNAERDALLDLLRDAREDAWCWVTETGDEINHEETMRLINRIDAALAAKKSK